MIIWKYEGEDYANYNLLIGQKEENNANMRGIILLK